DPNNRIAQFTLKEKDDARVVHEIYLNVLNRAPTAKEVTSGVAAIRGAAEDFKRLVDDHAQKRAVFEKYAAGVPAKQAAWEQSLLGQKPANWKPILPTLAKSSGDKLRIEPFGFVLATGAPPDKAYYTIEGHIPATVPITGLRLEVFPHASLPARGPGRAPNGNFVLNELYIKSRPLDKLTGEQTTERLRGGNATFSQTDYTANFAIDGNSVTGWAVSPEFGKPQTAVFKVVDNKPKPAGQQLQIVMEQGYGGAHNIGHFRWSYTTDPNPSLKPAVPPELMQKLEVPVAKRTAAQAQELRNRYLATDPEYRRLEAIAAKVAPKDARVLGAQDLAWALINTPAFLFNH
ncbi:MAG: hypothetical protein ACRCZF_20880, partial [Gemmataceae bacterium]